MLSFQDGALEFEQQPPVEIALPYAANWVELTRLLTEGL